ncbi:uncharacterized protein LOC118193822 isoform X2 [Stegodyphus dumicola]|uniref:uncharacterized protein LOC118193822 isoform X2 n=1 Tax=Stegodyphus dumicola TaxID=202533 RepID=UPI0015AD0483|nr:uncharacterized protein LOC118193822 isoform X2 [Stegodyphus dumicola]
MEMQKRQNLKVSWKNELHHLAAANSKVDSFNISMRNLRDLAEKEAKLVQCAVRDMEDNLIDPDYILKLTKSIHSSEDRSITDYINRNTEILLNEHAATVRQQMIEDTKKEIQNVNAEVISDAEHLEGDVANFLQLIQTSYESSSASLKKVADLSKDNYKKVELISETESRLFCLRSEVLEMEQELLECLMCAVFVDILSPTKNERKPFPKSKEFLRSFGPTCDTECLQIQKNVLEDLLKSRDSIEAVDVNIKVEDVCKVIERLKESNLSVVHNSLFSKRSSAVEKKEVMMAKEKLLQELEMWNQKLAQATEELETEKKICKELNEKVSPDLMRTAINHWIEELLNEMGMYPLRKVKECIKVLEAEKKLSERKAEEALRAQRLQQRLQRNVKLSTKKTKKK